MALAPTATCPCLTCSHQTSLPARCHLLPRPWAVCPLVTCLRLRPASSLAHLTASSPQASVALTDLLDPTSPAVPSRAVVCLLLVTPAAAPPLADLKAALPNCHASTDPPSATTRGVSPLQVHRTCTKSINSLSQTTLEQKACRFSTKRNAFILTLLCDHQPEKTKKRKNRNHINNLRAWKAVADQRSTPPADSTCFVKQTCPFFILLFFYLFLEARRWGRGQQGIGMEAKIRLFVR